MMAKKNDGEKTCMVCGRIITDPQNKTGLCPRCKKTGKEVGTGVTIAGAGAVFIIKKCWKPLLNIAKAIIRK